MRWTSGTARYPVALFALIAISVTGFLACSAADAACEEGCACRTMGLCAAGTNPGVCVAKTNAQCAKSEICKTAGRCAAESGKCVAASDADCEASALCKSVGACVKDGKGCTSPEMIERRANKGSPRESNHKNKPSE